MSAAVQITLPIDRTVPEVGHLVWFDYETTLLGVQRFCGTVTALLSDTHARVEIAPDFAVAVETAALTVVGRGQI